MPSNIQFSSPSVVLNAQELSSAESQQVNSIVSIASVSASFEQPESVNTSALARIGSGAMSVVTAISSMVILPFRCVVGAICQPCKRAPTLDAVQPAWGSEIIVDNLDDYYDYYDLQLAGTRIPEEKTETSTYQVEQIPCFAAVDTD